MEILTSFYTGLMFVLVPATLLYCFIGVFLGTFIGVLPGIGSMAAISMILPLTFSLDPASAIVMIAGVYYGAEYGGSTASILMNIPGTPASSITAIEGYPMARSGRAGVALFGAAVMVSQDFLAHHPEATAGLVRAINRGLADTVADPDAAIDAVARRNPAIDRAANRARLTGTLAFERSHPDGRAQGLGDADDARPVETARLIATAKHLPHRPAPDLIFDHRFVPALKDRVFLTAG